MNPQCLTVSEVAKSLRRSAGIGAVAIGLARHWPRLAVTGLEPLPVIAEHARRAIDAAGLARRVDVRASRGEDLTEHETYDMVLVPSAFIPPAQVDRVVARAVEAMRPGGWLVFLRWGATVMPLPPLYGGFALQPVAARDLAPLRRRAFCAGTASSTFAS